MALVAGHPRVRGEHGSGIEAYSGGRGSSPRARGTPVADEVGERHGRVIPACAGNTLAISSRALVTVGHPRVRGEHELALRQNRSRPGSSPRARGTLALGHLGVVQVRVIPACAGNT